MNNINILKEDYKYLKVKESYEVNLMKNCVCGNEMQFIFGDVKFNDGLVIKNVPHYECDYCGEHSYDLSTKILKIAKKARIEKLTEVDFLEFTKERY